MIKKILSLTIFLIFTLNINVWSQSVYEVKRLNNGEPIITQAMFILKGATTNESDNINGPSVIRVPDWIPTEQRANPKANYYMYFAHHSGKYIRMAWAEHIDGPYELYEVGTGIALGNRGVLDLGSSSIELDNGLSILNNHIASPDVHVDDENERIIMYFHAGDIALNGQAIDNQYTFAAHSPYGLDFSNGIVPVMLGPSYFRVFKYDGNLYAFSNGGDLYKAPSLENPWEIPANFNFEDRLWDWQSNPLQDDIRDAGFSRNDLRPIHVSILKVRRDLHVFYSRRGELSERIQLSIMPFSSIDPKNWNTSYPPIEVLRPQEPWEGRDVFPNYSESGEAPNDAHELRDPYIFQDIDNSLYLFYTGNGEDAIGIAALTPVGAIDQVPLPPNNVTANFKFGKEIELNWTDASDNESGFLIERSSSDGSWHSIANVAANKTIWQDSLITASSFFSYRVSAYNQTGVSTYSNTADVTTENTRIHDTYIRGGSYASDVFGGQREMVVKTGNQSAYTRIALVQFNLNNISISEEDQVKLRLYRVDNGGSVRIAVHEFQDNWNEGTLSWNGSTELGSTISETLTRSEQFNEWDISDYVHHELNNEDRIISLGLQDVEGTVQSVVFATKEAGVYTPEINIIDGGLVSNQVEEIESFFLAQNYPNPFNPTTRIQYHLPMASEVQVHVYDITGRIVQRLWDDWQTEGTHTLEFNGSELSSGLYIYRVVAGSYMASKTMMLLK